MDVVKDALVNIDRKFWTSGRLETFTNWPFAASLPCNSKAMAAAGFYAVGGSDEPDLVMCFMCGKQLDGWESHDDPWEEHKSHQSDCPYIKLGKRDELEFTIEETLELVKSYYLKISERRMQSLKQNYEYEIKGLITEIPKSLQKARKNKKSLK